MSFFSISSMNLSFILPTVSEKIDAEVPNTAFSIWLVPNSAIKGIQAMQAVSNLPISAWFPTVFPREGQKTARSQSLIGRFETACIAWIPLIAEYGTNHIEKAVFVTSASIFSETVRRMKLKFVEEIEKKLIYHDPSRTYRVVCLWTNYHAIVACLGCVVGNIGPRFSGQYFVQLCKRLLFLQN